MRLSTFLLLKTTCSVSKFHLMRSLLGAIPLVSSKSVTHEAVLERQLYKMHHLFTSQLQTCLQSLPRKTSRITVLGTVSRTSFRDHLLSRSSMCLKMLLGKHPPEQDLAGLPLVRVILRSQDCWIQRAIVRCICSSQRLFMKFQVCGLVKGPKESMKEIRQKFTFSFLARHRLRLRECTSCLLSREMKANGSQQIYEI